MSRYWGYSKRPKDWKRILKDIQEDNNDEDKPINVKPVTVNKPINVKPTVKPRIPLDSSVSHL